MFFTGLIQFAFITRFNLFWDPERSCSCWHLQVQLSFSQDVYSYKVVREISAAEKCAGWEEKAEEKRVEKNFSIFEYVKFSDCEVNVFVNGLK